MELEKKSSSKVHFIFVKCTANIDIIFQMLQLELEKHGWQFKANNFEEAIAKKNEEIQSLGRRKRKKGESSVSVP